MIQLMESSSVEKHLDDPRTRIIDPRSRVKYLQGHIPKAVNIPLTEVFDKNTLAIHSEEHLSETFGAAGVDLDSTVVLYDSYDGQSAAMLAWILEYLGHPEVSVLSDYLESWAKHSGRVLYRPVTNEPKKFDWRLGSFSRANINDVVERADSRLLDLRGHDEFLGKISNEPRPGHIPGATNLPWTDLIGRDDRFLRSQSELREVFSRAGLKESDRIITYCSNGPRAALGYIAVQLAGFANVRVFDGSFHQWAQRRDLSVEGRKDNALASKSQTSPASPCIVDNIPGLTRAE